MSPFYFECLSHLTRNYTMAKRSKSSKERRARRKERKLLEARIKSSHEKCDEGLSLLEPTGRNAQPNYVKAMVALEAAIEIYEENTVAYFLLGECLRGQEEYEKAIERYSQCLEKDPLNIRAMEARAASYVASSNWSSAFVDYSSIINVEPDNDHAYNHRGLCILSTRVPGLRLLSSEFNQCVNDFKTAIRLNEANYYAWANLGRAYEEQGLLKEALQAYSSALRVKEEYHYAQLRRACLALRIVESSWKYDDEESSQPAATKRCDGASVVLPALKSLDDVKSEVLGELAAVDQRAYEEELLKAAIVDFQSLMAEGTDKLKYDPWLPLNLGSCFLLQKDINRAEEEFRLTSEIINARPQLVACGEAEPIQCAESLQAVLNLRVEVLKAIRGRRFLADRH
ncbi:hypothetical protein, conserved [Trypanosoma brucei gambiense DAL972]|uniref:Uncharacterized protein n=1 Tax=Trypanosoma brucei gambiense (strain MHOM/CI/86/DAL972) TaxID=679716 RepID=D0A7J3_TRYB9|nr:hypothetical protein, conserved [Trypanosoma brucei gambiense DAL972]CBH17644.1 hypothetical protein, conserved [Trypanosoma brucei gambiense DAL972]|eukprot:XP_011779908.1 hypothetical protein, conserved [Trypanosoma brucei gambiense DAL972]